MDKGNTKSVRRTRVGRVISDAAAKTVAVRVESMRQHPKYKKYMKHFTKFQVHDPNDQCQVGDLVRIEECRPMSKTKKWVVREIIAKSHEIDDPLAPATDGRHPPEKVAKEAEQ